eukprot:1780891-Amphidinium_carterae.2
MGNLDSPRDADLWSAERSVVIGVRLKCALSSSCACRKLVDFALHFHPTALPAMNPTGRISVTVCCPHQNAVQRL